MTSITKENIDKFKSYGFILTPVHKSKNENVDKKPKTKNGKWFKDWQDRELLSAERLGVFHKDSRVFAVDPDDKTFVAHLFMKVLPETFEIGKVVEGRIINTQRIYKLPDNVSAKKFSYKDAHKGTIIELLPSTQSIIAGTDRVIINNVEPTVFDPAALTQHCKLIAAFSELFRVFPTTSGNRDETHLALAGALARTDIDTDILKKYVSRLCVLTGDNEIKNRTAKLDYQKEQLAKGVEEVAGIKKLSQILGGINLPAFDLIKNDDVEEEEVFDKDKHYPIKSYVDMLNTEYPKPQYLLEPIVREKTVTQISGDYGAGKTQLGLRMAMSLCSGLDFLDWKNRSDPRPTLYVEGELPAFDIRDRLVSMTETIDPFENINEENFKPKFQSQNLFILTLDDLELGGFKYGFERLAYTNNEDGAAKGRILIENTCKEIKKRTGKFPVLFLDNISALCSIDENKAQDWSGFINWLMRLKTMGIVIIYFHHLGKSTGTASGSNMALRLVDTHIVLRELPPKSKFDMTGKNVQVAVEFDKCRNFGGAAAKSFILTCNENGLWKKYPMLDQKDFLIIRYHNEGYSVKQMCEEDDNLKESTVGRRILKLEKEGIIKR